MAVPSGLACSVLRHGLHPPPPNQLQFTEQRQDMKAKCPRGPAFFKGEKKRLNYIFKKHKHAREYQQCLRPEAEMPGTRVWKINTAELSTGAFFFLGLWKAGEGNTWQGKGQGTRTGRGPLPSSRILLPEWLFQTKLSSLGAFGTGPLVPRPSGQSYLPS